MAVWRLQVNTGGTNVADYCLKNHVAAMGWSLRELTQAERSGIHTFLDYCNLARTQYKSFDSVCRMVEDVKEGDLLWMRSRNEGKYYIARVKANSTWVFREDAVQIDAANQLTNIDWYPATDKADEESVPGAVATSFIMGSTIQRIKKNGVEAYSQMLYNRVHDSALDLFNYPDPALSLCEKHFYSLLQPEDVEDLLALWLYDTKGYVCIPSTNKIATPKYECVLVDPNDLNRKHIYIQVKKGDVDLNTDDYSSLNGEVYLLTTEGNVQNAQKYVNVKAADPTVIYGFAINPDKSHIIPENVLYWVKFLTEIENNRLKFSACKGIMFDTNISYSDTNESEMILGNKIAAYGVVCSKRLLNQAVGKSLRTHNLKPKKGAQVMRKNEKITALYERLSRDDFGKDDDQQRESNSISNQKAMLEDFAARQGFTNIVHFTDDGISGTCFDRPGFLAMMKEVEAGNVEYLGGRENSLPFFDNI